MPRQRRVSKTSKTKAAAEIPTQTQVTTKPKGLKMPLDSDRIRDLYAKRRKKGIYTEKLIVFLGSGDAGVSVREEWPTEFPWDESKEGKDRGKQATTLKQGFENAKEKKDAPEGSEYVDVLVEGEDVFLINKVLTGEVVPSDTEAVEVEA